MKHEGSAPAVNTPGRWGLPPEVVPSLAERLRQVWSRFRPCFTTRTRDTSEYAWVYVRGLLTMDTDRNYAHIARQVIGPTEDGQNLQQFISDSPWSAAAVFEQIQRELAQRPEWQGGLLTLDESGDARAGDQSVGSARQYFGRAGRVAVGQVGVALGYYHQGQWALLDAQLYLPKAWFDPAHADLRRRGHVPSERTFATKPELGVQMIRQARARGVPFAAVACDSLYGRNHAFRSALNDLGVTYVADTLGHFKVYPTCPAWALPEPPPAQWRRGHLKPQVVNGVSAVRLDSLVKEATLTWETVPVRPTERGPLRYRCARGRVWTGGGEDPLREEWLLLREEHDGTYTFALSNAPRETSLAQLATWRCLRYFGERTFQDAKSEAGWDELVARKYRAWEHHTALDALALWYVATTKWEWQRTHPRDPELAAQLEVEVLPGLSMANVRELLRVALPLEQLSPAAAIQLVTQHLVRRSRATRSRLKAQKGNLAPPGI